MKKAMATAGKTATKFVAARANLFAAVIFAASVIKITCLGPAVLDRTVAIAASLIVLLLLCVCYAQGWKIQELLAALDRTIDERDDAENELKLEELKAFSPASIDELNQLEYGEDADPLPVQLAWIRYRAEQAQQQQQTAPDADVQ